MDLRIKNSSAGLPILDFGSVMALPWAVNRFGDNEAAACKRDLRGFEHPAPAEPMAQLDLSTETVFSTDKIMFSMARSRAPSCGPGRPRVISTCQRLRPK